MSIFGDTTIRLDPWQPEFGAEAPGMGKPVDEDTSTVVVDVEVPADLWRPIVPSAPSTHRRLVFVDGVRRVEARIVGRRDGKRFLGAFGSWGVGAVAVVDGNAGFLTHEVGRHLALGSGETLDAAVDVSSALKYVPVSTADDTADGPVLAIHGQMRLAEERLATGLADDPDTIVLGDGPLHFEHRVRGAAVGYVKRIVQLYLPESQSELLATLPPGTRTPLFGLGGRFARYAWFVRLAEPRRGDADTSGLVRMEVSQGVGVERARALADACTALAPGFAGIRGLHARAPQNLLPIAALEVWLRRQLGDVNVVHRQIQTYVAANAPTLPPESRHV